MNCFFMVKVLLALSGLLALPHSAFAQSAAPTGHSDSCARASIGLELKHQPSFKECDDERQRRRRRAEREREREREHEE